jgi:Domain of unknown function (DUF4377)
MQSWRLVVTLFLITLLASCSHSEVKTFFVDNMLTTDCPSLGNFGSRPDTCLKVKFNQNDDWFGFSDEIQGFDYEQGYNYELLVRIVTFSLPAPDAFGSTYQLVQLVKKEVAQ